MLAGARRACAVALAAAVLGGLGAAGGVGATPVVTARTYFANGQSPSFPVYRSRVLGVAGDGSFYVKRMRWWAWGSRSARGRGTGIQGVVDQAKFSGPVTVRLSRPRRRCGRRFFTRGLFVFTAGKPAGIPRRWRWTLAGFPCGAEQTRCGMRAPRRPGFGVCPSQRLHACCGSSVDALRSVRVAFPAPPR